MAKPLMQRAEEPAEDVGWQAPAGESGEQAAGGQPAAAAAGGGRAANFEDESGEFRRVDISPFVPEGQADAVARIVAAGMKVMYSPDMRDDVMQAVQSQEPAAQVLAQNVLGLIGALDQKAQGGLPEQAIFPAGVELLGEAAEVLIAAGKEVSQQDYADSVRLLAVLMAQMAGHSQEQIDGVLAQNAGGGMAAGEAPEGDFEAPDEAPEEEAMQ